MSFAKEHGSCSDCEKGCGALVDKHMNQVLFERDDFQYEACMNEHNNWESLLDLAPDGKFAKYDKV